MLATEKSVIDKAARDALISCDKAQKIDPNSWKAMFRRGEAYVLLNCPDEAKVALNGALANCGGDVTAIANINKEMAKVEKLMKKYVAKEKKMATKMFSGGGLDREQILKVAMTYNKPGETPSQGIYRFDDRNRQISSSSSPPSKPLIGASSSGAR